MSSALSQKSNAGGWTNSIFSFGSRKVQWTPWLWPLASLSTDIGPWPRPCTQSYFNVYDSPKKALDGSSSRGTLSHTTSARLNAAIFSQEFAESREFVAVQPWHISVPADGRGGLWTQLHHRIAQKTCFHVLQDGFQSFQLLLRLPTQGDACGYALCDSHCFQMPSQPICYPPFTKYNRSIKVSKVRHPCVKVVLKSLVTVQSEGRYKVMLPLRERRAVVFYQAS